MFRHLLKISLLGCSLTAIAAEPTAPEKKNAPPQVDAKPKLAVTISKETTFITEPLAKDGYPDYEAALERAAQKGTTAKNNVLVLLYRMMGPQLAGNELSKKYYQKLGIKPLQADDPYFVTWEKYIEAMTPEFLPPATAEELAESKKWDNSDDVRESQIRTRLRLQNPQKPWQAKEYPHLSAWLNDISPSLDLLRQVEQHTHYYDPTAEKPANPYQGLSHLFGAISQRALRDAGEERWDAAWAQVSNLLTLAERLARVPDRFMHEEAATAYHEAFRTARAIAFDRRLDTQRLERWGAELAKRQIPSTERCYTWTERLETLNRLVRLAKQKERPEHIGLLGETPPWHQRYSLHEAYDFDQALRLMNAYYDQMAAGYAALQRDEPTRFLSEISNAQFEFSKSYRSRLGSLFLGNSDRQQRTEMLVKLYQMPSEYTLIETVEQEYASRNWLNLTQIQFALELYRREHKRYPEKLEALVPKFFNQLPLDYDTNKQAYRYQPKGQGFLLYGLGRDGKDSGGRNNQGLDYMNFQDRLDDLAVFTADQEPE